MSVETQTSGNAGELILNTGTLTITDGAGVSAQTKNSGQGGNLKITASKLINLTGQGIDIFIAPDGTQTFFTSPSSLTVTSEGSGNWSLD